ncbi:MAG: hypothetical protein IJO55_07890 [Lachnospiraceae bacterium]|nr:hypothetical protein [Lachnospiraceae bacterium]
MKKKLWKIMAAASSFMILAGSQAVMVPYANAGSGTGEYMVSGPEQCRRLLTELVSMSKIGVRNEWYLTGKDYEPETLVVAQMFSDTVNISNTVVNEYQKDGHRYVTCRIGVERLPDENGDITESGSSGIGGSGTGKEDVQGRKWSVGDVRSLSLGDHVYQFRCIDDDYGSNSEYQKCALFLCDTVIRSDIDSTESQETILTFGGINNYKVSYVRAWLEKQQGEHMEGLLEVNTGVNSAYLGATVPGTFSEFSESGFLYHRLPYQDVRDKLFLLSLEEAFLYKEQLWNVKGGESSRSRGYWLRTPAFSTGDNGTFSYGSWEYAVDLEKGCIRPLEVGDGSIGIRPAFCLPQE